MRHKCNVKYKFGINYSLHWTDQMLLMLDSIPSMSYCTVLYCTVLYCTVL